MKFLTKFMLAGAILGINCSALAATPADDIRQVEKDFNAAYAKNDLPKYFSYYAEDFRGMFPDGPTSLADYRKEWSAAVAAGNVIVDFTYSDMQVNVSPSGDAAVASYRATARMKYVGKDPVDEKYLETDVLFKRPDGWKVVEVHYSAVPDKH
jgi:ketosteroid isomerase-like protein